MRTPYQRRTTPRIALWQLVFLGTGVALIVLGLNRLMQPASRAVTVQEITPGVIPTIPDSLTRSDVLPTPTIDPQAIPRGIKFPGALVTSRIINAARTQTSWETRYLGDSVGHLQGTSWIGESGGNVVLAGHVTTVYGEPGPFAYLFEAELGDQILVTDGEATYGYRVTAIERVEPQAVEFVAQDGNPRLTLITCDDWDYSAQRYASRLIVIAEPETTSN
jgi:sortase A